MKIINTGEAFQQRSNGPTQKLSTFIPIKIRRLGGRRVVIPAATSNSKLPEHDAPILKALSRAFHWQRLLDEGVVKSGSDIARQEGVNQSTVNEVLRLALLSPAMVRDLLAGFQPKTLSIYWLKNNELPSNWDEQRDLFGEFDAQV